jgi:oligopeptidase B
MNKFATVLMMAAAIAISSCKNNEMPKKETDATPPIAKKKPKELSIHGDKRIDNYYWLNERENPEVIDHLNAELAYYEAMTGHTEKLQDKLFKEMKSRIK